LAVAFWRLFYHIVWATKEREPLITQELEAELYGYLRGKADSLGAIVHAIGGIDDHVHIVASVPPKLAIADFVRHLKGSSSHHINHLPGASGNFGWQRRYGMVSLGQRQLERAIEYACNQKEHHRQGTTSPALERMDVKYDGPESLRIKFAG
jgi:putative transposase